MAETRKTTVAKAKRKAKEVVKKVEKKAETRKNSAKNKRNVAEDGLELLVTVVGRSKAEYYVDVIESFEANLQMTVMARGTADASMLRLLGLSGSEKAVIFSVIKKSKTDNCLYELGEKFRTVRDGKGIAFTLPLTSVIGALIFRFLSNSGRESKEDEQ